MNTKMVSRLGILALFGSGFLYALQAIFPKYLSSTLGAYETVTLRFAVAFGIVVGVAVLMRKNPIRSLINSNDKQSMLVYALAFPVSAILFTVAVFYTKVSLAIFSFYIANVLSSFAVGHFFFKDRVNKNELIALGLLIFSLIMFTNPFKEFSLDQGFIIGLLSGIVQTIAILFQKKIKEDTSLLSLVFLQTGVSTLIGLVVIVLTQSTLHLSMLNNIQWFVVVLYGASFAAVSYLLIYGFKRVSMSIGVVLISSELIFAPILAFLWFFEKLTLVEGIGGIAVILAIVFANKKPSRIS